MANQNTSSFESLQSLRRGQLGNWRGLPPECRREVVEQVFGNTGPGPDGVAMLGDELVAFRDYPATPFGPNGFTVWFVGDTACCMQVNSPSLTRSLEELLGVPEAVAPSRLESFHEQWIYASRGLAAHVRTTNHEASRIYFYVPTSVENFLQSPLSRVETRRIPLE